MNQTAPTPTQIANRSRLEAAGWTVLELAISANDLGSQILGLHGQLIAWACPGCGAIVANPRKHIKSGGLMPDCRSVTLLEPPRPIDEVRPPPGPDPALADHLGRAGHR